MKVVSYLSGVPSPNKSPHKIEVLKRFVDGVNKVGDIGISHIGNNLIPCDVAVIQGWVHEGSPKSPHLLLRKNVVETQKRSGKHTIIVDSNLFNYKEKYHPTFYYRYSMDGVFPTTGNYFWDHIDSNRWKQISRDLNLSLKDWRKSGNHILVCTQRNGGWSMRGLSVVDWLNQTVSEIRKYTDRPIVVRGHPGDKEAKRYLGSIRQNMWTLSNSQSESIMEDLANAHAVVTYNSTPGVAASIEGIPAFITDPYPNTSQAFEVGNYDLSKIETPELKERQAWIEKLSMCHWKFDEISNGSAWQHFKQYAK